jgi:trigger factor
MESTVETTGPTQRKLSVTVPASEVDAAFDQAYRQVGKTARVPGFRPGKIPRGLLEVHYGPQVKDEVQQQLVTSSFGVAIQKHSLKPIAMPEIAPGELAKGIDFSYSAEVEIQPEIELKKYKNLVVEPIEVEVLDEEIEGDLNSMREQSAQLVPVMLRDVVEEGDIVQMDYEAFVGGSPVAGSKAENAMIEIGGEGYLPGFSDGLVGARVPSEREIPVDFPEDYSVGDLAGKKATFKVAVKELKAKELPTLDDDFAKDLGAESLEALTERVTHTIRIRKEHEAQEQRKRKLLEALVAANPFDVPPSLVASQADQMIAGAAMRVEKLMGKHVELSQQDLDHLRDESTGDAEFQVRSGMLMLEVAREEGIEVTELDIDAEIESMAASAGTEAQRLRARLSDPDQRSSLTYRMLEEKTLAFLLEHAADSAEAAARADAETQDETAEAAAPAGDTQEDSAEIAAKTETQGAGDQDVAEEEGATTPDAQAQTETTEE